MEGHSFQQLKAEILKLSKAVDWEVARKEWKLVSVVEAEEPETCLCGHYPIIEICQFTNQVTGFGADVGNRCLKRFLGFESEKIFGSLRRIKVDREKSISSDAAAFFRQRGILNDWEYNSIQNTFRKRNLTEKQRSTRRAINDKIVAAVRRRGVS